MRLSTPQVVRLLVRMRREAGEEAFAAAGVLPEIDTLVLFDRASDLTTPLLTQVRAWVRAVWFVQWVLLKCARARCFGLLVCLSVFLFPSLSLCLSIFVSVSLSLHRPFAVTLSFSIGSHSLTLLLSPITSYFPSVSALGSRVQHSYEGLLDELFEIKNNTVSVDADVFSTGGAQQKGGAEKANPAAAAAGTAAGNKRKLPLNSADILFSEIRDLNFAVLGPHLHMRASQVGSCLGAGILMSSSCIHACSLIHSFIHFIRSFIFIHPFIHFISLFYLSTHFAMYLPSLHPTRSAHVPHTRPHRCARHTRSGTRRRPCPRWPIS